MNFPSFKISKKYIYTPSFYDFIKSIGEAATKEEEAKIVEKDIEQLKVTLSEQQVSKAKKRECIIRMLYAEMLGYSVDFAHIHAVNFASSSDMVYKRIGYLATWLCVNPEHEFMYLIVSTMQRDLRSANSVDVCSALMAAAKILRTELMSALYNDIVPLLTHTNVAVRRRTVTCLHAFYRRSEGTIGEEFYFRNALCDANPAVMAVSLNIMLELAQKNPSSLTNYLSSFLSILDQVIDFRLPREFDYHGVPAPWIQIKLLKLISYVGAVDDSKIERTTEVIQKVIEKADPRLFICQAIIYEAVCTICEINAPVALFELAAQATGQMFEENTANMVYIGITALSKIVQVDPTYVLSHQNTILNCLEDADEVIRYNTVNLLSAMCTEENIQSIAPRLLKLLKQTKSDYHSEQITNHLCHITEEYSPSSTFYLSTMNQILQHGEKFISMATVQGIIRTIAEGDGEDEEEDVAFRVEAVHNYLHMLEIPNLQIPPSLYQIIVWTIGEFSFLSKKLSPGTMIDCMLDLLEKVENSDIRCSIVVALAKLIAQSKIVSQEAIEIVTRLASSEHVGLQQRVVEFLNLVTKYPGHLKALYPFDGCCAHDIELDGALSFLDGYVAAALERGAPPRRERAGAAPEAGGIRTAAYELAERPVIDIDRLSTAPSEPEEVQLVLPAGTARWGVEEAAPEPTPEAAPSAQPAPAPAPAATRAKPTRNAAFLSSLVPGSGPKRGQAKRRGARQNDTGPNPQPRPQPEPEPQPQPEPRPQPEAEVRVQKQLAAEAALYRVGLLARAPMANCRIEVDIPPECIAQVNSRIPASQVSGLTVAVADVAPGQPQFIEVKLGALNFPQGGSLNVRVSYDCPQGTYANAEKMEHHPILMTDLLRPATEETTESFGAKWKDSASYPHEVKATLNFKKLIGTKSLTPDIISRFLLDKANIKLIQVIGRECIAAGKVVPCKKYLLCHLSVQTNTANVIIKSQDAAFSNKILSLLEKDLI